MSRSRSTAQIFARQHRQRDRGAEHRQQQLAGLAVSEESGIDQQHQGHHAEQRHDEAGERTPTAAALGAAILRPQHYGRGSEGKQRQHGGRRLLPAIVLRESRKHEAIHHRTDIAGGREPSTNPCTRGG